MAPSYQIKVAMAFSLLLSSIAVPADDLSDQLERQIPGWLERYEVTGASVALIRDARVVWVKGFGMADAERGLPMQAETVCQVGPVSQALTAWGIMTLVEAQRLDLDAPIGRYLSRWQLPPSQYDHSKVTVRRLLNHSAGILQQRYLSHIDTVALPTPKELLSGVAYDLPPVRVTEDPGTGFLYSDPGYLLLQLLIEEVSGDSFAAYMQREVFAPLAMKNSYYDWREVPEKRRAAPHDRHGQPLPVLYPAPQASVGLHTSVRDLAAFVAAGLPSLRSAVHGYPVLQRSTIQQLQRPSIQIDELSHLDAEAYGLGYFVEETPQGVTFVSNGGYLPPGWFAHFFGVPQTGDGLVVLSNSLNGKALIKQITSTWAEHCRITPPQLVLSMTKIHRTAWIAIAGIGLISLFLLYKWMQALQSKKLTFGRRRWFFRLAGLATVGFFFLFGWTTLPRLQISWLPYLSPWPSLALSLFCSALILWIFVDYKSTDK